MVSRKPTQGWFYSRKDNLAEQRHLFTVTQVLLILSDSLIRALTGPQETAVLSVMENHFFN